MNLSQQSLEFLYDPLRYEQGAPVRELAQLRDQAAVIWVEEHELPQ